VEKPDQKKSKQNKTKSKKDQNKIKNLLWK